MVDKQLARTTKAPASSASAPGPTVITKVDTRPADEEPLFTLGPLLEWWWFSLRSLRRHRAAAMAVAVIVGLVGGVLVAGEPSPYQASVTVLLRTEGSRTDTGTVLTLDQASRQANGVVTRRESLDRIIDELDLERNEVRKPFFGRIGDAAIDLLGSPTEAEARDDLRRELRTALSAEPSSYGESILISVTWGDAEQAKQIADLAYDIFFEDRQIAEITPKQEAVRLLGEQADAASSSVAELRSDLGLDPTQDAPQGSDLLTAIGVERDLKDKLQAAELELEGAEDGLKYQYALLSPAEVPLRPVSGRLSSYATLAVLVALCTIGASLLLDRRRGLILEAWQLRRYRLRVLATVSGAPGQEE